MPKLMILRLFSLFALAVIALPPSLASAKPALVIDADSGRVLHAEEATALWYPASLTKLMTTYVVLSAVREGRVTLDTPLLYTVNAQAQPASKMGFPVNTVVTVDNALKLLIVKSANDIAVTLAEGVGGSVPAFVAEMNRTAQGLGMTQSRFRNPNGWHDPDQVTSARDMAILGRALYRDFPQYYDVYSIGALQLGKRVIRGHNALLGRFNGADGMKTGFTCPSGFNLVASAHRGKRHLIVVVLGHASSRERTERAAELMNAGFGKFTFWRTGQEVATLPAMAAPAPNLRAEVCEKKKDASPEAIGEVDADTQDVLERNSNSRNVALSGLITSGYAAEQKPILSDSPPPVIPVPVFLGANPAGPAEYIALATQMAPNGGIPNEPEPAPAKPKKAEKKPAEKKQAAKPAKPAAEPKPAKPATQSMKPGESPPLPANPKPAAAPAPAKPKAAAAPVKPKPKPNT
jgi:D-alanyl-D-alanine carboxypeptidase